MGFIWRKNGFKLWAAGRPLNCDNCPCDDSSSSSSSSSSYDCSGASPMTWIYNDSWNTDHPYYVKDPPTDPIPHTQEYKWCTLMGDWPFSFEDSQTILLQFHLRYDDDKYRVYVFLDDQLWHVLDTNNGKWGEYNLGELSGVHFIEFYLVYMPEMDGMHYHYFFFEYTLSVKSIDARCFATWCADHPADCAIYQPPPALPAEEDEFE